MGPSEVVPTTKLLYVTILGDTTSKGYTARRAAAKSARTCCRLVDEASVPRTQHHQTHMYPAATQGGITAMEHTSDLVVLRARRFERSLCSTSLARSPAARSGRSISSRWEQAETHQHKEQPSNPVRPMLPDPTHPCPHCRPHTKSYKTHRGSRKSKYTIYTRPEPDIPQRITRDTPELERTQNKYPPKSETLRYNAAGNHPT
jgi:hypothetical protein